MRTRLVVGLATLGLGTLAFGCSSGSPGAPPNPYPDVEHFCAAVAAAECQSGGVFGDCSVASESSANCEMFRTSECLKGAFVVPFPGSDSAVKNRTYTSANVPACLDALNTVFSNSSGAVEISFTDLFGADGTSGLVGACEAVFAGSAGHGAGCTTTYDCTTTGDVCAPVIGQAQGQCATVTTKHLNDACADPGDQCASGTYCATSSTGVPKCQPIVAMGSACTTGDQCGGTGRCTGGVCGPRSMAGQSCATDADCDPTSAPFCDVYRLGGAVCAKGLVFAGGSADCQGYLFGQGLSDGGATASDAGSDADASAAADSASPVDAATGG